MQRKKRAIRQRISVAALYGRHKRTRNAPISDTARHGDAEFCLQSCRLPWPIGQEKFLRRVDVVHQKSMNRSAGKAKENPDPEQGRDVFESTRERLIEIVPPNPTTRMEHILKRVRSTEIFPASGARHCKQQTLPVYAVSANIWSGFDSARPHRRIRAESRPTHEAETNSRRAVCWNDRRGVQATTTFFGLCFPHDCRPFAGRQRHEIVSGKSLRRRRAQFEREFGTSRRAARSAGQESRKVNERQPRPHAVVN